MAARKNHAGAGSSIEVIAREVKSAVRAVSAVSTAGGERHQARGVEGHGGEQRWRALYVMKEEAGKTTQCFIGT